MNINPPEWRLHGYDWRIKFEDTVAPKELKETLVEYQRIFGKEFGLKELLQLKEMLLKARLVEGIVDFPEHLMDEIGIANNSYNFHSSARALEKVADMLEEYVLNRS